MKQNKNTRKREGKALSMAALFYWEKGCRERRSMVE